MNDDAFDEVRGYLGEVIGDDDACVVSLNNDALEVFVEHVSNDFDEEVRFRVKELRGLARLSLLLDRIPLGGEASDIEGELLLCRAFGGGAHDDASAFRKNCGEDLLESSSFRFGQFARNTVDRTARNIDEVATGEADLAR